MEPSSHAALRAVMPEGGNLAWVPWPNFDRVDVLDRFNGVPTLGVVTVEGRPHLFWRLYGYVDDLSIWLYVPLTNKDLAHLAQAEGADLVEMVVLNSPEWRYVSIGIAENNRLFFEREWHLRAGLDGNAVMDQALRHMHECLRLALDQKLPPTRREMVQRASTVVSTLVTC